MAAPIIKVKMGAVELRIPASALSILVWAVANKKAGIPFPNKPERANHLNFLRGTSRSLGRINGSRNKKLMDNRIDATWSGSKLRNPSFISRKELPQVRPSKNSVAYCQPFWERSITGEMEEEGVSFARFTQVNPKFV